MNTITLTEPATEARDKMTGYHGWQITCEHCHEAHEFNGNVQQAIEFVCDCQEEDRSEAEEALAKVFFWLAEYRKNFTTDNPARAALNEAARYVRELSKEYRA